MSANTWENLPKSMDDSQTIETYIAGQLAIHNADNSAHGQSSEAIYNHRISSILDHLDESITLEKLRTNKFVIQTEWESLDGWEQILTGSTTILNYLGVCRIVATTAANSIANIGNNSELFYVDFGNLNPYFETILKFDETSSQLAYFGIGDLIGSFAGFKVNNGTLYALWCKAGTEYTQSITGITLTDFNRFSLNMTSGSQINFYVNDVLVHTATTNLPDGNLEEFNFYFSIKNTSFANRGITILRSTFYQDFK